MHLKTIVFLALLPLFGSAAAEGEMKLNPTKDADSPSGVYIPKDLQDCFSELTKMLPEKTVKKMKAGPEKDMILYHHGLGTWIRNNWGLWSGSRLLKHFSKLGLRHPDDMSSVVLDSYWRHLNGKPLQVEEQVKYFQAYWKKMQEKNEEKKKSKKQKSPSG